MEMFTNNIILHVTNSLTYELECNLFLKKSAKLHKPWKTQEF